MKNYLIIHGHFYQPPREDPWIGEVPFQESALPFHDWNSRITSECYAANSASRYLDPYGRINEIINNYEYLSYNFGPTLLWWLRKKAPLVYKRIIDADKKSVEKYDGHGNAIAQVYNHIILPLATPEDITTQVRWGLQDFEFHFGRKAEGIWLSETAVNDLTLDVLISEGVKFVILSPWQAEAVKAKREKDWKSLNNNPIDSGKPYIIQRPEGQISVFFYNHILAQGISFEHYLRDAHDLYNRILDFHSNHNDKKLIHTATDGEIYGHHEPFGDMAYAALVKMVQKDDKLEFTNYGRYLEENPPTDFVQLKSGEDSRGTSWSCFHGVSRWYKHCGCSTGGGENWNQYWRNPLRDGLNELSLRLKRIFFQEMEKLSDQDPYDIRNRYISVLTGEITKENFGKSIITKVKPDAEQISRLLKLLEGQKYLLFMFTSCGWFFSEISGIETVQNMAYALKAIRLYQNFTETDLLQPFLAVLDKAHSNIPDFGTGKQVFTHLVLPHEKGPEYAGAVFVLPKILGHTQDKKNTFGDFRLDSFSIDSKKNIQNRSNHYTGKVTIEEVPTASFHGFSFTVTESEEHTLSVTMTDKDKQSLEIHMNELPYEIKTQLNNVISEELENTCMTEGAAFLTRSQKILTYAKSMNVPPSPSIERMAEIALNCRILGVLNKEQSLNTQDKAVLRDSLKFAKDFNLSIDINSIQRQINFLFTEQFDSLSDENLIEQSGEIIDFLEALRPGGVMPDITHAQNQIYHLLKSKTESFFEELRNDNISGYKKLRALVHLAAELGINVDPIKERAFTE